MDNEQRASLCLSIEKPSEFQLAVSADLYRIWNKYPDWLRRYGASWKMSNVSAHQFRHRHFCESRFLRMTIRFGTCQHVPLPPIISARCNLVLLAPRFNQQSAATAFFYEFCLFCNVCLMFNSVDAIAISPETVPDCFGSFRNFPLFLLSHTVGYVEGLTVT